jgi:hypothetical protein
VYRKSKPYLVTSVDGVLFSSRISTDYGSTWTEFKHAVAVEIKTISSTGAIMEMQNLF